MYDEEQLRPLSLSARLAIALHCFSRICHQTKLNDPSTDQFITHLWEWLNVVDHETFKAWEGRHIALIQVGLGDSLDENLRRKVAQCNLSVEEFQKLLGHIVEILYGSFYGASNDKQSMEDLRAVLDFASQRNVAIPNPHQFSNSKFSDRHGWGKPLTSDEIDAWLNAK